MALICGMIILQLKVFNKVCGSHSACLDCMLPEVQVTAGLNINTIISLVDVSWFVQEVGEALTLQFTEHLCFIFQLELCNIPCQHKQTKIKPVSHHCVLVEISFVCWRA